MGILLRSIPSQMSSLVKKSSQIRLQKKVNSNTNFKLFKNKFSSKVQAVLLLGLVMGILLRSVPSKVSSLVKKLFERVPRSILRKRSIVILICNYSKNSSKVQAVLLLGLVMGILLRSVPSKVSSLVKEARVSFPS